MHVQDWSAATKTIVPVGQGDLDWKKIFSAAKIRRHQELFRGNELGCYAGERPLSAQIEGLIFARDSERPPSRSLKNALAINLELEDLI